MPTKTVRLELDAYEKLKAARRPRESFSDVVRRARFVDESKPAAALLEDLKAWAGREVIGEEELAELEEIQKNPPPPSPSHWEDEDAA